MPSGPDDRYSDERMERWQRARHAALFEPHVNPDTGALVQPNVMEGPGFLYRPRQVVFRTGVEQTQPVVTELHQYGGYPDGPLNKLLAAAKLPFQVYLLPLGVDIPQLVTRLREQAPAASVSANTVFCGEPAGYTGGPDGPPTSEPSFTETGYPDPEPGAPEIAILDTGYDLQVETLHPGLARRVTYDTPENPLTSGGYLAPEAGHGTFEDGVVMQLAPEIAIRQVNLLSPYGDTDDVHLAAAIQALANSAPVINLSLGGYAQGDVAPSVSSAAIAALPDTVVVVAAAGNNKSGRKFWPAAELGVISVGALDTTAPGVTEVAKFSNYGGWVKVYAPGVNVYSTYLRGNWMEPDGTEEPMDGWATWSGTSFATPQVAAAIANKLRSGGTAGQAAQAVVSQAPWMTVTGPPGPMTVRAYIPPGRGVIYPA